MAHIKISIDDDIEKIVELSGLDTSDFEVQSKVIYDNKYLSVNIKELKQNTLEEAYQTYKSDPETYLLEPMRKDKSELIGEEAFSFIESKYPVRVQQLFQALFTESVALGYTNRASYIQQLLNWCKSIMEYTEYLESQLILLTSASDIQSFSFDFSSFEETDPEVTAKAAAAMEN